MVMYKSTIYQCGVLDIFYINYPDIYYYIQQSNYIWQPSINYFRGIQYMPQANGVLSCKELTLKYMTSHRVYCVSVQFQNTSR